MCFDKSSDSETYASCDSSLKTQTKDIPPAVDIQTLPESDVEDPNSTTGSPSFSCSENVKSPRVICNKSGVNNRKVCKNNFVYADLNSVYADESTLPPGQQLGTSENTTRFPVPSDVCMDQLSSGIFTSSSYDDDFRATLTNLAPDVAVNLVPTKRVNTIHPQSQILGDLASPVLTRSRAHKSKFGESAFIRYIQDQQRTNHTDQLHCLSACFLSQLEPTSIADSWDSIHLYSNPNTDSNRMPLTKAKGQ
ncbi:hypothetical protein Tco_0118341, partial [Tanacetum coccineum]